MSKLSIEYLISQIESAIGKKFRIDYSYTGGYGPNSYQERSFIIGTIIRLDLDNEIIIYESENMGKTSTEHFSLGSSDVFKISISDDLSDVASIPASDRVVSIDHNSKDFEDLLDVLDKAESTISDANEDFGGNKAQILEEISLGRKLLESSKVRIIAVVGLILAPLYTAYQHTISEAAKPVLMDALNSIRSFFGL